jgi:hypothetical protein
MNATQTLATCLQTSSAIYADFAGQLIAIGPCNPRLPPT